MVLAALKRKNRDFFLQVTLVVENLVTSNFGAKSQYRSPPDSSCRLNLPFSP